jgi:Mg-chelatase subunit ChlD
MSFLTPLYVLGLLAIAGPIIFHMIRRSPRGEVPFSSLMFLVPSPPRLTRRSRLDNLLLLLIRAAVLGLLAFAFARPFLRQVARMDFDDVERRRVAILIDTSASMRRADLWARAKGAAAAVVADCRPSDQIGVFAFDAAARSVLGFDEAATIDPARRQELITARLDRLAPSWGGTHLGQALIDTVTAVEEVADASEKSGRMPRRVVLISDLQQGSRLDVLGDFEWPSDVELDLKSVTDPTSNAGLQWLAERADVEASATAPERRVRVANETGSTVEKFALSWVNEKGAEAGSPVDVYVPPGESRVVRVPLPKEKGTPVSLRLKGDTQTFDNTLYLAETPREVATVLFVGNDEANDPAGLRYYLERAVPSTPRRVVHVVSKRPDVALAWEAERFLPLIVLAGETTGDNVRRLKGYLQDGGTVLVVATGPGRAETLAALAGSKPDSISEATLRRDVMLGDIAFENPLFAPLAGPQFNDFTKIRFWKYRRLGPELLAGTRVVARFENDDPAIVEKLIGGGRLVVFTSGWSPADSQLARSSKFVPLVTALIDGPNARPPESASLEVYDRLPLPAPQNEAKAEVVQKPDGSKVTPEPGSTVFTATDEPGVYRITAPAGVRAFAVNLDPLESRTSPLPVETLEQFGVRMANPSRKAIDREYARQMQNLELENRQKFWRWLIVAALGILVVETWLAGRLNRSRPVQGEVLAT